MASRSPLNTPNQNPIDPVQPQDNGNRNSGVRRNEGNLPTVAVTQDQVSEPAGKQTKSEKRREKIRRLRKAGLTWISLGTFLIVLAYTLITRNLWQTTRDSVTQVRRQIAVENRAWLVFDTDYADNFRASGKVVNIPVRLVNNGNSPAETVNGWIEVDEVPKEQLATFDFANGVQRNLIKAGIIHPHFPHTTEVSEWQSKGKPVLIDATRRQQFTNGDIIFFVQGEIDYEDVFHVKHWLHFCHAISPDRSSRAAKCVSKNRIDDRDE